MYRSLWLLSSGQLGSLPRSLVPQTNPTPRVNSPEVNNTDSQDRFRARPRTTSALKHLRALGRVSGAAIAPQVTMRKGGKHLWLSLCA
jgi:hypothetical protein